MLFVKLNPETVKWTIMFKSSKVDLGKAIQYYTSDECQSEPNRTLKAPSSCNHSKTWFRNWKANKVPRSINAIEVMSDVVKSLKILFKSHLASFAVNEKQNKRLAHAVCTIKTVKGTLVSALAQIWSSEACNSVNMQQIGKIVVSTINSGSLEKGFVPRSLILLS